MRCVRCSVSNAEALIILTHGLCVQIELTLGACKYYMSMLGGSEGNAYFAYVVRGGGGSRGKMLM